jgi:hypothetical protein
MPGTPGLRTGLATINPTGENPSILRTTINAVITWLEGNAGISGSGLLSARPVSTPSTPGITGRKYYATDVGLEFRDTGTGWVPIGIPIGGTFGWISTGDLTAELVVAEGRTLASTSYPVLDALIGAAAPAGRTHLWNGGVSPGAGLFRIPNYAGKTRVAPDPGNTVIPNSNRAVGQTGGEERHTLSTSELPQHRVWNDDGIGTLLGVQNGSFYGPYSGFIGANQPANNMQPYAVETVLVRIT